MGARCRITVATAGLVQHSQWRGSYKQYKTPPVCLAHLLWKILNDGMGTVKQGFSSVPPVQEATRRVALSAPVGMSAGVLQLCFIKYRRMNLNVTELVLHSRHGCREGAEVGIRRTLGDTCFS